MRRFLILAVSLPLAACDTLPPAQDGACGNKVVDPTEDCDTFATAPAVCRAPGTPSECRYACGKQSDGTLIPCPPGMGCGTDGTCRAPLGTFVQTPTLVEGTFVQVYVGDVDGDGREDVIGVKPGVISTTFFDGTLAARATIDTPRRANVKIYPLVRDLDGDGHTDLVVGSNNGTLVELGRADGKFAPLAFPSSSVPGVTNAQILVIQQPPPAVGDTVFIMGTFNGLSGIALLQATGQGAAFAFLKTPASDLAGPVRIGHLIEDPLVSPCGELAFAFNGGAEVDVYTSCISDGSGGFVFNDYTTGKQPAAVKLPNGETVVRGPTLVDANADGHLDFVIGTSAGVDVAYGAGDGSFTTFAPLSLIPPPLPLAIGDLNGDGIADFVTSTNVFVNQKNGPPVAKAANHGAPWTEAVIADFNRDGVPDVAAGSDAQPNVSFFIGAGGGALNAFVIPSAPTRHFVVGDFDGDLVRDLAVAEVGSPSDPLGDSISILFGNAVGAPSPPISMGRFTSVTQTTTGKFTDLFKILGATDALLTSSTLTSPAVTVFGTFAGSGDRVLRSPLGMNVIDPNSATASSFVPLRYAFGHFTSATGPIDVAALSDQNFPTPQTPVRRSWLIPTDAQGRFQITSRGSVPLDGALDWSHAAIAAVDLDGTGTDQLLVLGPSSDPNDPTPFVAIGRTTPGPSNDPSLRFEVSLPVPAPARVVHDEGDDPTSASGRLLVLDLDGDARPDVVAVATISGVTSIVVFWNDHGGQLGTMTTIPNPNGQVALDVTSIDAGGASPALAVLTSEGVTLVSFVQRTPNVAAKAFDVSSGHRIAAGDVDGDGVTDLAVVTDKGIEIHHGKAVRP
jgi:hypothetical protein